MSYTVPPFYDIGAAVGTNKTNEASDVMLIQFFLFFIMISPGWGITRMSGPLPSTQMSQAVFPHDGIFRPALADMIKLFQSAANQAGLGPLVADGIASPGAVAWGRTDKNKTRRWYSIHAMNDILWRANNKRFLNLPQDTTVPAPLRKALSLQTNISLS